ncbi:MAG TPA: hypothetical protein VJR29_02155 [bacterium]|nr:hypothetical protein [bacterium]
MGHIEAIPGLKGFFPSALRAEPFFGSAARVATTSFHFIPASASAMVSPLAPLGAWPLLRLFGAPLRKLTTAADKVLADVALIDQKLKTSVYNANTKVDLKKGIFEFDCSGMVNWILERSAPTAFAELKAERPRVIEYVKALKAIPANQPSAGWRRIAKIADAEPGDVIAWPTPDWYPSNATGHMGILVAKPEAVDGGYLLRLADSTSYPHGDDSREGGTGFGYGTVLITVDAKTGAGTGQGWTGRHSYNTVLETPIYVGRPLQ